MLLDVVVKFCLRINLGKLKCLIKQKTIKCLTSELKNDKAILVNLINCINNNFNRKI